MPVHHMFRRAFAAALCCAPILSAQEPPPNAPPPANAERPRAQQQQNAERAALARQVIDELRQQNPDRFQQLMQLRKDDAKAFAKELHQLVVAWRERHGQPRPRLSREELACRELAKRYHECEDEQEKETIRHDLALAVDKAFETRMKAMEARVQRMEKELDAFQKRLDLLKENREAVCGERLDELLRPPELDWDGDW